MNIDSRLASRVYRLWDAIDHDKAFDSDERRILKAAVVTMAEGFADLAYTEIPDHPRPLGNPGLLEFFFSGVRWHWAREAVPAESESWAVHHDARHCPFGDVRIDLLIRRFEAIRGPLWIAVKLEGSAA